MASDVFPLAADPIEDAAKHIGIMVRAICDIDAGRREDPSSYPMQPRGNLDDYWARRIIAVLLDEGWTPPNAAAMQARFAELYPDE